MNFPSNELIALPPSLKKRKEKEKGTLPFGFTSLSLSRQSFLGISLKFACAQVSQSPNYMRSPLDTAHTSHSRELAPAKGQSP